MFGSTILDVAVGLVFLFLAVSLAASAITETISSALKLRQTTLRQGIGALLNDPEFKGLALSLYNHALVNPLAAGTASKLSELRSLPAYIPSRSFALALIGVLEAPPPLGQPVAPPAGAAPAAPVPDPRLGNLIAEIADPQIRQTLTTLLVEAGHDRDRFVKSVGDWFDGSMDRLSGWYKRYTQAIGAAVAFAICVVLNADALRIGAALWKTPALTAELKVVDQAHVQDVIATLDRLGLLGWAAGNYADLAQGSGGVLLMVLGWIIVAGASLFGAPFWFDTLQRFVQLGGTGPDTDGKKGH